MTRSLVLGILAAALALDNTRIADSEILRIAPPEAPRPNVERVRDGSGARTFQPNGERERQRRMRQAARRAVQ